MRPTAWAAGVCLAGLLAAAAARAQEGAAEPAPDQVHAAQAERLRAELANQLQLQACELIDELVFGWLEAPPFANATPVMLADVIAPLGFGSGLEALLENHLAQVLISNPNTQVRLAYCPACQALVVHSDARATVISRGFDQPRALARLRGSSGAEHALFLDFEIEGSALVLRARITKLDDALSIVYARTLSTQTATAPLLRSPDRLLSAEQARREYVALLEQRGPLSFPVGVGMTAFAPAPDTQLQMPIPIPWVRLGAEFAISSARAWTGELTLGLTYLPTMQAGAMVQARASRLITGTAYSLTHPNAYAFVGASVALIQGDTASLIDPKGTAPTSPLAFGPVVTYFSLQTGLSVRVSQRVGAAVVFETMPSLWGSEGVGNHLQGGTLEWIPLNSVGAEVSFAF